MKRIRRSRQVVIYLQLLCIEHYINNKNFIVFKKQRKPDYISIYTETSLRQIKYKIIKKNYPGKIILKSKYEAKELYEKLSDYKIERIAYRSEHFFEFFGEAIECGLVYS